MEIYLATIDVHILAGTYFKAENDSHAKKITEDITVLLEQYLSKNLVLPSTDSTLKMEADVTKTTLSKLSDL
ncbi:hypothetical protein EVU96_08920 [Bacillus infantis]|uniref:hypothetical protein n=1 Tax=Bacillus infantis TaxID=324767 RepID=UPI00101D05AB|nr:hypothetical protein [Bacillus infantis]RYI30526.1 hypothetical protein EVU96_08920 [Bacillus infantis]